MDISTFPDPTYRDTVLVPLIESVKTHYAAHTDAINRAHLVMLGETKILSHPEAATIANALEDIAAEVDLSALDYTGEHEDYFFLIEAELTRRHRAGGRHHRRRRCLQCRVPHSLARGCGSRQLPHFRQSEGRSGRAGRWRCAAVISPLVALESPIITSQMTCQAV